VSCSKAGSLLIALTILCLRHGVAVGQTDVTGRPVRAIRFVADEKVDEDGLRLLLPIHVGDIANEAALKEAERLLRLKDVYRHVDVRFEPDGDGAALVVTLERERVIGVVRGTGYRAIGGTEMRRLVRLAPGAVFEPDVVEAARHRVQDRYAQLGYPDARVEVEEHTRGKEVDINLNVTEGEPFRIAKVVIDGDAVVASEKVAALERAAEGKPWSRDRQREVERGLLRAARKAGYYEARVSSEREPAGPLEGTLHCTLNAGPPFVIEVIGNASKRRADLLREKELLDRLLITNGTWRETGLSMQRSYQESGFYKARVQTEIDEGPPKHIRFVIEEGRRYRLRQIGFDGNEKIGDAQLRAQMATQPRRCLPWPRAGFLVDAVLDDDLSRIWFFYREQGFANAEVVDARRQFDDAEGTIDLTIVIEEGEQTVVRDVSFAGFEALGVSRSALKVQAGKPLNLKEIEEDRRTLIRAFSQLGHPEARVEGELDRQSGAGEEEVVVRWRAAPGKRLRIGRIVVQGNIDTRDEVILRELPFAPGDPLDTGALLDGQGKVYKLGLFRSVSIRPLSPVEGAGDDVREIGVQVAERPPGLLQWGIGFNTRDGIVGTGELDYDNLQGMNRRLAFRAQAAIDPTKLSDSQYLGTITFREPRLAGSPWKLQTDLIGERATKSIDPYSFERGSFVVGVDRKLWSKVRGGGEMQIEYKNVFDVEPDAQLTSVDEGILRTVAPTLFALYDGRDDPFSPQSGFFDTARVRYTLPTLSTVELIKLTGGHSHYISLSHGLLLLYAIRAGWGLPLSGSDQLPVSERFFLGGRSTVRGFAENDVGPRGVNGDPIGGDVFINLNTEIQIPLVYGFAAAVFLDGGAVYLQNPQRVQTGSTEGVCAEFCAFSFSNFRRSTGLGLRYRTPIGPLSLDYGFKLDRRSDESLGAVHFNIGVAF